MILADVVNDNITIEGLWNNFLDWVTTKGIQLLIALIVLFIVFKITNFISKKIRLKMQRKHFDKMVVEFVFRSIRYGVKIIALAGFLGYVGIDTASMAAFIATLGVGIGLALQGALSNLAGGFLLVIMRPFKIGDFIESGSNSGTVEDIKVFYTHIVTPDNRQVLIPNGSLLNNVIVNHYAKDSRRVEVNLTIGLKDDFDHAQVLFNEICEKNDLIFGKPEPVIRISEFIDGGARLSLRVWTDPKNFWDVKFYLHEQIKKAFMENNISVWIPQVQIREDK